MVAFQSFLFGISIALAIGPIALLIINYGLNCGLKTAALSGTGAALADFTYSLIAFAAGTGIAVSLTSHQHELKLISSLILAAFGAWMLFGAIRKRKQIGNGTHTMKCKAPLLSTYALTIINPLTIILFIGFAGRSEVNGIGGILVNGLGVFTGSLIIQLSLALFGNTLKTFFKNQTAVFSLNVVSALAIIVLGFSKII
jgi:arginine exporter protein ArgO